MKKFFLLYRAASAAMLLCAFCLTVTSCQKPDDSEKPDDQTEEPVDNPDDNEDDGPDTPVVPDRPEMTGLTFDISVEPGVVSAVLDIIPSDPEAHYYAQVLDASWFTSGYTDQAIIDMICQDFGAGLSSACVTGSILDYQVTNIMPSTDYFVIAFGVDTSYNTYNSPMTKAHFTTLENQPTDAYAPCSITAYWRIDDLAAYNPSYESLKDSDSTVIAAMDLNFNGGAVTAHYVTYIGDETGSDPELLIQEVLYYGMTFGYTVFKDQPTELIYRGFGYPLTICTVALDETGNYGELFRTLVTFTEDGVSQDFTLFDEYFSKK